MLDTCWKKSLWLLGQERCLLVLSLENTGITALGISLKNPRSWLFTGASFSARNDHFTTSLTASMRNMKKWTRWVTFSWLLLSLLLPQSLLPTLMRLLPIIKDVASSMFWILHSEGSLSAVKGVSLCNPLSEACLGITQEGQSWTPSVLHGWRGRLVRQQEPDSNLSTDVNCPRSLREITEMET